MISIIIPVYNALRWLPQCLDSVLSQDYKDIEVILVNDASTDKSLSVCERYAAKDSRIRLIDKPKNEGVELARRSGYLAAQGEYVMYIDADDWLDNSQVLSKMYYKAEETGADCIIIGFRRVLDRHKWFAQEVGFNKRSGLIEGAELHDIYFRSFFYIEHVLSINNIWGKLYRKSILDKADVLPLGFVYGEDHVYNMQIFRYLNKIYVLNEVGYNYRYGGMTSRFNPCVFRDMKRLYSMKEEILAQMYPADEYAPNGIRIQLKEVLKDEICQRIEFSKDSRQDIINYMEKEIKNPLYSNMLKTDKTSAFWNDPFVKAFAVGDCTMMYDICRARVRKEHRKRMIKRLFARIIQSL